MTAEKSAPLTAKEVGATYRVVRAAMNRWCDDMSATYPRPCTRTIRKGERYVRAVQFKNHDTYSWIDRATYRPLTRPMVTNMCFGCAAQYHTTGLLVITAEHAADARALKEATSSTEPEEQQ